MAVMVCHITLSWWLPDNAMTCVAADLLPAKRHALDHAVLLAGVCCPQRLSPGLTLCVTEA